MYYITIFYKKKATLLLANSLVRMVRQLPACAGFRVYELGLGFEVWGIGFRVQGLGLRVWGLGFGF